MLKKYHHLPDQEKLTKSGIVLTAEDLKKIGSCNYSKKWHPES
jgi:hypothetical protein